MARKNGLKNVESFLLADGSKSIHLICLYYGSAFSGLRILPGSIDTNSTITFNVQTKAVMADVVHDNVKEKVTAVREVVSGHSNNEIIMVLQFYDYDVEKTIQAYVEDGAKEALQEWQFSGTKPVKKKKNKKKGGNSGGNNVPASPGSVSSEASSAVGFLLNGDASKPVLLNGEVEHKLLGIDMNQNAISNGPMSTTYPNGTASYNVEQTFIPTTQSAFPTSYSQNGMIAHNDASTEPTMHNTNRDKVNNRQKSPVKSKEYSPSPVKVVTMTADTEVTLPGAVEVKVTGDKKVKVTEDKEVNVMEYTGTKDKSPTPQPQRQPHSHHNRQRTHSGSHGHHEGKHGQHDNKHGHHDNKHGHHEHERDRTMSTSSTDGKSTNKKHAHMGLERSSKDLHRQTVSLERLRLVFNEEINRSYKRIKSVFDELRTCLNVREAQLVTDMNTVSDSGKDTFTMRQGLATDLKTKIDRAERMNETELAELRSEIKHFVSDRKVDEDLARTTRFLYDDDNMKQQLKSFGEIVPLKCMYIPRRNSNTETSMSLPASEPVHHIPEPIKPSPPPPQSPAGGDHTANSAMSHLDAGQAHEMAELQRRLKHSLTLEGIPVETYPERPVSAPAPVTNNNNSKTEASQRPESSRRNYRNRRRNERTREGGWQQADRPRDGAREDSRSSYSQTPSGERVILIGRKTGPQGGSRPPRGASGSGRGRGGYRGDRGGWGGGNSSSYKGGNADNLSKPGDGVTDHKSSQGQEVRPPRSPGNQGRGQSPRKPPQPQREKSGSLRRGGASGRGNRGPSQGNQGGSGEGNQKSISGSGDKREG